MKIILFPSFFQTAVSAPKLEVTSYSLVIRTYLIYNCVENIARVMPPTHAKNLQS